MTSPLNSAEEAALLDYSNFGVFNSDVAQFKSSADQDTINSLSNPAWKVSLAPNSGSDFQDYFAAYNNQDAAALSWPEFVAQLHSGTIVLAEKDAASRIAAGENVPLRVATDYPAVAAAAGHDGEYAVLYPYTTPPGALATTASTSEPVSKVSGALVGGGLLGIFGAAVGGLAAGRKGAGTGALVGAAAGAVAGAVIASAATKTTPSSSSGSGS